MDKVIGRCYGQPDGRIDMILPPPTVSTQPHPVTPDHPPGVKGSSLPPSPPPTASDCYSDWIFPFVWPINSIYRYFYYNGTAIKTRSGSRPRVFIVGMKRSNTAECFLHGMFVCLFVWIRYFCYLRQLVCRILFGLSGKLVCFDVNV